MKTPKPKVATKKRLLESIEHLQMELMNAKDRAASNWSAKEKAERDLRDEQETLRINRMELRTYEAENVRLNTMLQAAVSRAEAFELVLRLRYRAEKPSAPADCRNLKEPTLMQDGYVSYRGVVGRP